jgi:hypothetical protein
MSSGPASFPSRRSGGVHPTAADLESIRELLKGYGSASGILKELTQKPPDRNATN